MRKLMLLVLVMLTLQAQAQEAEISKEKNSRHYIGINTTPLLAPIISAESFEPEFRIQYKVRPGAKNHWFRTAYSYSFDASYRNGSYYGWGYEVGIHEVAISDSVSVRIGSSRNVENRHSADIGYEYQMLVGKRKKIALNFGTDIVFSAHGGKVFGINDTIVYESDSTFSLRPIKEIRGNDPVVLQGYGFGVGTAPFIAVSVPIRKRFNATFEMAWDVNWNRLEFDIRGLQVRYRPRIMLNYVFGKGV